MSNYVYENVDAAYAATCSDATLCSNPKGFFRQLALDIVELAEKDDWLTEVFEKKCGDAEKIKAMMENKELVEALEEVMSRVKPMYREKNGKVTEERISAAQSALEQGDLLKALALSSQAVLKAPLPGDQEELGGGVSLALSLWLRSEVLLKMHKYDLALEDLKMALKERLPAKMRAHYYWRMGHCYKGTKELTRAKVSYELAGRLLTDVVAKQGLAEDIAALVKDQTDAVAAKTQQEQDIFLTKGAKLNMPSLSNLVKIAEEEVKGRFAIAASDIKAGDVLLIESPYAACLLPDCYGTHCLHCFKRLEAPLWCPKCSGVAFCSAKCRDRAMSSYHTFECPFVDFFIGSGMSILSHIALRMVTQAGLETCIAIHTKHLSSEMKPIDNVLLNDIEGNGKKAKLKSRREKLNRSRKVSKGQLNSEADSKKAEQVNAKGMKVDDEMNFHENIETKSSQIYSLCTHSELRKSSDYLKRIVMSFLLKECLKLSGFFNISTPENSKRDEGVIVELILRNLQLLQFNAHEVYETVRGQQRFSGSKCKYIAVGIYPTGALFNHECYPSVARYFDGKSIVLRATRPLSPGQVVAENYGPHFLMRGLKERQRELACRYWFVCQCLACEEDWPLLKNMSSDTAPLMRCINKTCKYKFQGNFVNLPKTCPKCSKAIDETILSGNVDTAKECVKQYQQGAQYMDDERVPEAIEEMCKAINRFHTVSSPPHKETHLAQEALRSCYADSGNVHIVQQLNNH